MALNRREERQERPKRQKRQDLCDQLIKELELRGGFKERRMALELKTFKGLLGSGVRNASIDDRIIEISNFLGRDVKRELSEAPALIGEEPKAIISLEKEIIDTQDNFIKKLEDYHKAYEKLKEEDSPLFHSLPAWIGPHMEYIHQLVKTGNAWMEEQRNEATATERIQKMFQSPLFMKHLEVYQGHTNVEFWMMSRWLTEPAGKQWIAAIESKINNVPGQAYITLDSIKIEPVQRLMRFPLLLDTANKAISHSNLPEDVIKGLSSVREEVKEEVGESNKLPGIETISRKVNAELNRAGVVSDTFRDWIADLSNQCRQIDLQIAGLNNKLKTQDFSDKSADKIREEVQVLTAKKDKIEEKFIKIEEKFDKELNKILKNNPPGSGHYAGKVETLVNKTICPMFSHLRQRINDNFQLGGNMMRFKTLLGREIRTTPLTSVSVFSKTAQDHETPLGLKMEPDSPATVNLPKGVESAPLSPADEQSVKANAGISLRRH